MQTIILGIFLILHALVHLLYTGQSQRLFELQPDMTWPDGSWACSKLLGTDMTRLLVSILLVLVTLGFIVGGVGLFMTQDWWRLVAVGSAVLSAAIYILSWDGKFQALDNQGGVGILINLAIVIVVLILKWPA
ncbi:MAG: hypothetical protein JXB30_16180 [Anaerolineae bacterium]|nr:hypothetical protein [Anaerolineae bacterium]